MNRYKETDFISETVRPEYIMPHKRNFIENELERFTKFINNSPELRLEIVSNKKRLRLNYEGKTSCILLESLYKSKDWEQDLLDFMHLRRNGVKYKAPRNH